MPPPSPSPLSERRIQTYLTSKKLLSLPDDILSQIATYLLPLPPSNPPTITTLKHALSLSQTCQSFHEIVISRLQTLDFLTPTTYTVPTCRTPAHASRHLERFIKSATPYLEDLRLPQGYVPCDASYKVIADCKHLSNLSLPLTKPLTIEHAQTFFDGFPKLSSVTLDLPTPEFLFGLCYAPTCLTDVTFTKLPAHADWFVALSAFLSVNGRNLQKLVFHFLCESTKGLYSSALNRSSVSLWNLMEPTQALTRLSGVLQKHVDNGDLANLRELGVGMIPDTPMEGYGDANITATKILYLRRAIITARQENTHPSGLQKLSMRVQPGSSNVCVAFMSRWIDPTVDVEISFPDRTVLFPRGEFDYDVQPTLKEFRLWFHPHSLRRILTNFNFDLETLNLGNDFSVMPSNPMSTALRQFYQVVQCRSKVTTLRVLYDIPKTVVLDNLSRFLGHVPDFIPALTTLEIPADVVIFSASTVREAGLVSNATYPVKILRLSNFRKGRVTMLDKGSTVWRFPVNEISVDGIKQKAKWFLKGLPAFLRRLGKDFPTLEVLYMEQTAVEPGAVDRNDLFQALEAIESFEKTGGVDASTLRVEIMEWRNKQV